MAVGKNSLEFIAWLARLGWTNTDIRIMYDYAVNNDNLKSSREERWKEVARWYREEKYGDNEPR